MGKNKRIHLFIQGECGNQFFQYAFARSIQEKLGGRLIVHYDDKLRREKASSYNLLSDFNVEEYELKPYCGLGRFIFASLKFIRLIFKLSVYQKRTYKFYLWCAKYLSRIGIYYFDIAFYPFKVVDRRNIYIKGFFESARYFNHIDEMIKRELTPRALLLEQNIELYNHICNSESVCVTIKRSDISNPEISDVYQYDISYFYRAIQYICKIVNDPVFIVFSDDVDWCRDNIHIDNEMFFETPNNPIWEKIRLMSGCKHFIIHNSTFSWWVQHLSDNPNKIVIAPTKWMQRDDQPIDIYEEGWIYMTPEGNIVYEHE